MTTGKHQLMHTKRTNGNRQTGFTLIELLVVIAIIALLAAILFPVFARVREEARTAACQSNLKQIALSFQQYTQDFDGRYPQAIDLAAGELGVNPDAINASFNRPAYASPAVGDPNQDRPEIWPAKLEPYLKNRQVFSCPSRTTVINTGCKAMSAGYANKQLSWPSSVDDWSGCSTSINACLQGASMIGYGYNIYYLGGGQYPGYTSCQHQAGPWSQNGSGRFYNSGIAATESQIAEPSGTVLVLDNYLGYVTSNTAELAPAFATVLQYGASGSGYNSDIGGNAGCDSTNTLAEYRDTLDPRHNDGLNVAFCDGHVKWLKKEVILYKPAGTYGCNNVGANSPHFSNAPKFLWNRD
jgi:prepilin-type N-terminal cleavage/methylation domain-containing protein/prepilin-type processing-associated H-X9-DG protein